MRSWKFLLASVVVLSAFGCGGGGGSASGGGGGSSSTVSLFATDNLVVGYDHVFVSITRIELTGPSGNRVVFDEPAGRVVDLRSLRDTTGRRFRLLSNRAITSGAFTGIQVTVKETATIFATGNTTGTEATFDGSTGGNKVLALTFPTARPLDPRTKLIIDFDLPNWDLTGTTITATGGNFLAVVEDSTLNNPDRHDRDEYRGTISALSGTVPDQTFTLTQGTSTVRVKTDANTQIFNENGQPSPTLANSSRVEVYGAYSVADEAVIASRIKIDNEDDNDNEVKGRVSEFTVGSNTITLEVGRARGFVPTSRTLTVNYADDIRFFGNRGVRLTVDAFEALLANGAFLEVEGTLSGTTLTAKKIKVEDGDDNQGHHGNGDHSGPAELTGAVSQINAEAGTFSITPSRWEGLLVQPGRPVSISTSGSTEFKVNGDGASRAAFFAALSAGTSVKVEGTFDPETRTVLASEAKVGRLGGGND